MDMKRDDGTSYELSSNRIRKHDWEVVEGTCIFTCIFTSETRTVLFTPTEDRGICCFCASYQHLNKNVENM